MDNMRIEKFDKEKHYEDLCKWLEQRKCPIPTREMLSDNGAIVPDVGCGFLYLTDSSMAHLDFFVTNPMADEDKRTKAMDVVTSNLIMWAKEFGVSHLVTDSKVQKMQKLAFDYGFLPCGFTLALLKEL